MESPQPANPNSIIFPKLITLWNQSTEAYFDFLGNCGFDYDEALVILGMIQDWIEKTKYHTLLNE